MDKDSAVGNPLENMSVRTRQFRKSMGRQDPQTHAAVPPLRLGVENQNVDQLPHSFEYLH